MVAEVAVSGLNHRVVTTLNHLQQAVEAALSRSSLPLAFDTETTGLDPRAGHLVTLQWQQASFTGVVVDMRHLDLNQASAILRPLFTRGPLVVGHNLKFDILWLMEKLSIYPNRLFDTLLAEQLLKGLGRSEAKVQNVGLGLKDLSRRYLNTPMSKEERSWFIDLDTRLDEWNAPLPPAQVLYAINDVRLLPEIMSSQMEQLKSRGMEGVAKLEMRALPAIASIEQAGIRVDTDGWRAFIAEKEREAQEIETRALEVFGGAILQARTEKYDIALFKYQQWEEQRDEALDHLKEGYTVRTATGDDLGKWGEYKNTFMKGWREANPRPEKPKPDISTPNLASSRQIITALHQMGIAVPVRQGKETVDSEALQSLEEEHPEVHLLLEYRRAQKFVDAFGDKLLAYVTPAGRIHPEYVQIGASTGRMSCTRPNWQQVPSKGDGKKLRQLVVAEPGYKMLTADFSNIELRILADITEDETMLRLFAEGYDLHSYTARMMFGLDESVDVASETIPGGVATYRYVAKTINFGLVYGMSPFKLARTIKVTKDEAERLMNAYFALYPGVAAWMSRMRAEGVERLLSTTLAGRQRLYSLPRVNPRPASRNPNDILDWQLAQQDYRKLKSRVERQSMNTPIQGTSADITKLALALLYEGKTLQNGLNLGRMVAVVHDEIVIEAKANFVPLVKAALAEAMGQAAKTYLTRVTLPPVEVTVADYWSK